MATVAVDATGADLGPGEVAEGALLAAKHGVRTKLFGPAEELSAVVNGNDLIEVIDAPLSIAKDPEPVHAVRTNPTASIVQTVKAVAAGDADAFVAAGTTGAALAAALMHVRRIKGIHRPAMAVPVPLNGRPVILLDVGANLQARPEQLLQFAFMGGALARTVLDVERPKVALLSNGTESSRGTPEIVAAHELFNQRLASIDWGSWIGNVEANSLAGSGADVVVCDGFVGNVLLKSMEGAASLVMEQIKSAAKSNPLSAAGGLLLKPATTKLKAELDPELQGGAYMLGLRSLGVIPHGRFTRKGFSNAILLAAKAHNEDLPAVVRRELEQAGALRSDLSGV